MKGKWYIIPIAILCFGGVPFGGNTLRAEVVHTADSPSALQFDESEFDFGNIREDGGTVTHSFRFRNTGTKPVVIVNAESTCGCTVPTFSRKPVMPSAEGSIEVAFDPMNRPGRIDKKITIVTSEGGEPLRLWIYGNVVPREKGIDELYPAYIGSGIRAETSFHSFSYVEHGRSVRTGIGLINTSDRPVKVDAVNSSPRKVFGVGGVVLPVVLEPNGRCELAITADLAEDSDVYGTVTEHLRFEIDGRRSDVELVVTGIAIDNRSARPDNFVPKVEINKNIVKFGLLKRSSEAVTEYFDIANTGEAPLRIRAVEGCGEGIRLSLSAGDVIAAGERRSVGVTVEPSKAGYGSRVERIRLITDDPARPVRDMKVTMITE